ncbi:MAG: glucose 1-dehydrogenase [Parcubacteria group bacterium]|jgi:3-oxoacyl-[acyl-carrier protein] reductase
MQDFAGKTIVITGAGRGIGAETAREFARQGGFVVINDLAPHEQIDMLMDEIGREKCASVYADISNEEDVARMSAEIHALRNTVDVLVNNAGIVSSANLQETTLEKWNKTFAVNLTGTFLCTKHIVPLMTHGGAIVNLASIRGVYNFGRPPIADYCAAKAGVISFTKTMAKELAPAIRVNSVSPGVANTEMTKQYSEDFIAKIKEEIYLGDLIQPSQIAKAITFLASEDASGITGENLMVDGGQSLSK